MPASREVSPTDLGRYCSVVAWEDGRCSVASYSADLGDLVIVTYTAQGGEPNLVYVDGAPTHPGGDDPDVGSYADMVVGQDGNIHLAYYDSRSSSLRYAVNRGDDWRVEVVDSRGGAGRYASIALDSSGRPLVAYAAGKAKAMELRLARRNGSGWDVRVVDQGGVGSYASLVVLPQGGVRIAYYDMISKVLKLAADVAGGFGTSVVDDGMRPSVFGQGEAKHDVGRWCSAAADQHGALAVVYFDATSGSLEYMKPGALGVSVRETVDDGAGHIVGQFASLVFSRDGTPAVAYQDSTDLDLLLAYRDSQEWHRVTVEGVDQSAAGFWPNLAPAPDGGFVTCWYRPAIGTEGGPAGSLEVFRWKP